MKPKTIALFLLLTGFITIALTAQQSNYINRFVLDTYNPEYVKNEILIKFKDEINISPQIKGRKLKTGQDLLDKWLKEIDVTEMTRVFPGRKKLKSAKVFRDWKGQMREAPQLFNIYRLKFKSETNPKTLAEELSQQDIVEYAEPNYFIYTQEILINALRVARYALRDKQIENSTTDSSIQLNHKGKTLKSTSINDPLYLDGSQWYIDAIHAPEAWEMATGKNQTIAIIDTGVDWDHPDLDDNIWTNPDEIPDNGQDDDGNGYTDDIRGWDWINNNNNPNDDNSHGTHVAGIAAADGNNASGIIGVAFDSKIIPLKVLQSSGRGNTYDLIKGIEYAISAEADVINMSLGTYAESLTLKDVLIDSYADKIFAVAAAGNDGICICNDCPLCGTMFPAGWPFIMGVQCEGGFSNTDPTGPIDYTREPQWNYEFNAPGVNITSSIPGGLYRNYNGTSMACPQVAAACAIFKEYWDFGEYMDHVWAKFIFGSDEFINIKKSLEIDLDNIGPVLKFIEFTMVDTLPGCDRDGRADAGETIEIWATIRNCGGLADSVWGKIDFGEFEDQSVGEILDSSNFYGSISTWAWMDAELEPIRISIRPDVAHNRDIVFEYSFGSKNLAGTQNETYIINVEKGVELSGVLLEDDTLHSEYLYLVNESYRVGSGVTLYIEPGTEIQIYSGKDIDVRGKVMAIGNEDSLIWIHPKDGWASGFIHNYGGRNSEFKYCKFSSLGKPIDGDGGQGGGGIALVENCLFEECGYPDDINTFRHNIVRNSSGRILYRTYEVEYNNFYNWGSGGSWYYLPTSTMNNNNFFGPNMTIGITSGNWANHGNSFVSLNDGAISLSGSADELSIPNQFWGGINEEERKRIINDFWNSNNLPIANTIPILIQPSSLNHGHVWKVEIDSINPFDEFLEPLGSGRNKFDVYFNRPMDIEFPPTVGFGVNDPWLQRIVNVDAQWNADSTVWTAYYNIGQETGDGINTVHVRGAWDPEGFEIPPEYSRFKFKVQAAAAASIEFFATPGIGKVDLEWPTSETEDVLGYNMYRYYNLTDSTYSNHVMINNTLIIDTLYIDYAVIPDTTYHYQYKTVGTDLQETDFSKSMSATPFSAANGDSNGDLDVNILDLTTIVAYILEQDPEPFLMDAADVNYDGQINVLDIISIVQLISGTKSTVSSFVEVNDIPAYIYLNDGIIQLKSDNQIAALQFELEGDKLESIRLFSMLNGFEFSYGIVGGKLLGIIYSFNGNLIPGGLLDIIRVENSAGDLTWGEVFGGDLMGNYVNILTEKAGGIEELTFSENDIKVFPNPFNTSITLNYQIKENSLVNIDIYNNNGQKVKIIRSLPQSVGQYEINWDGTNMSNRFLPSGIYFCRMIVRPVINADVFMKDVKLVRIK